MISVFFRTLLILLGVLLGIGIALGWYLLRLADTGPTPTAAPATQRQIDSGPVLGFQDNGAHAWLGIPYAAPPIGPLRWRAPRPAAAWSEPLSATAPGARCPQGNGDGGLLRREPDAEACLFLNLWAPATPARTRLPVMFWIHGGGNRTGEAALDLYRGARLAAEQQVVVVSANYRLGPLGWFLHPVLAGAPAPEARYLQADASGNFGTLDLIAALDWVARNVEQFGGDPDNITLFGESAGAFNILSLMVSPLARDRYHKAIVQSGGLYLTPADYAANYRDAPLAGHPFSAREVTNRLLVQAGLAQDRAAAKALQDRLTPAELGAFLRARTSTEILTAARADPAAPASGRPLVLHAGAERSAPTLIGDGHVLPAGAQIGELLSDPARYYRTPLLLGSNRDEARLFNGFNRALVQRLGPLPVRVRDLDAYERDSSYGSDLWKAVAVDELAQRLTAGGQAPVYAYRFDWDDWRRLPWLDTRALFGAPHAAELPFVFGSLNLLERALLLPDSAVPEARELAATLMSYWGAFAYAGDPGRGRSGQAPLWLPWSNDVDAPRLLLLDSASDGGVRMSSDLVTVAGLRRRLAADQRFSDSARCAFARRLSLGARSVGSDFSGLCP